MGWKEKVVNRETAVPVELFGGFNAADSQPLIIFEMAGSHAIIEGDAVWDIVKTALKVLAENDAGQSGLLAKSLLDTIELRN